MRGSEFSLSHLCVKTNKDSSLVCNSILDHEFPHAHEGYALGQDTEHNVFLFMELFRMVLSFINFEE